MVQDDKKRLFLAGVMLAVAGLTAACESDAQRQMRLQREALEKSGELDKLKNQLDTKNPDPYAPDNAGTRNIGRFKSD